MFHGDEVSSASSPVTHARPLSATHLPPSVTPLEGRPICVLVRRGYHSLVPSVRRPTKTVARFMVQLRIPSRLGHRQKIMARLHLGITSRLQGGVSEGLRDKLGCAGDCGKLAAYVGWRVEIY
ncbi:hypothetical protein E2C01_002861 [Portunus trituberculatus]|uniref:Uncharacterized protein n=1 Tax=Portunus trituberculatus TaxID=210409 RepID=A0A5B7CLE3_PORTR|nr:hypothetical protein [Portunus trituberculatus]